MATHEFDIDGQDQAEVYDETHLDDEGDGDLSFEEADDVLDVTRPGRDAEPFRRHAEQASFDLDTEDDDTPAGEPGDVELVYVGLMRNQRGAQASAAHWEARRLSDDDIEELGYGPESEDSDD